MCVCLLCMYVCICMYVCMLKTFNICMYIWVHRRLFKDSLLVYVLGYRPRRLPMCLGPLTWHRRRRRTSSRSMHRAPASSPWRSAAAHPCWEDRARWFIHIHTNIHRYIHIHTYMHYQTFIPYRDTYSHIHALSNIHTIHTYTYTYMHYQTYILYRDTYSTYIHIHALSKIHTKHI